MKGKKRIDFNFIPEEFWKIEAVHDIDNVEFKSLYYGNFEDGKIVKKREISNQKNAEVMSF